LAGELIFGLVRTIPASKRFSSGVADPVDWRSLGISGLAKDE
jgi:hypothetical protein